MLGKETREMLRGRGSAIGKTLVVTIVGLVRASHWRTYISIWVNKNGDGTRLTD